MHRTSLLPRHPGTHLHKGSEVMSAEGKGAGSGWKGLHKEFITSIKYLEVIENGVKSEFQEPVLLCPLAKAFFQLFCKYTFVNVLCPVALCFLLFFFFFFPQENVLTSYWREDPDLRAPPAIREL